MYLIYIQSKTKNSLKTQQILHCTVIEFLSYNFAHLHFILNSGIWKLDAETIKTCQNCTKKKLCGAFKPFLRQLIIIIKLIYIQNKSKWHDSIRKQSNKKV